MEIKVEGKDLEKALKLLKRKVQRDGLMGELKKRRYYEKPSVKMKTKQREAVRKKAKSARRGGTARQTAAKD
ncbi:MAG: 30S ribosomal protein S21 [Nitrospirae bacterium]|nr:30S ribosomal protein S21 [Nitrospirota bacterium]